MADESYVWNSLSSDFNNDEWLCKQMSQDKQNFNIADCIRELTQSTWHMFGCTPIFNDNVFDVEKVTTDLRNLLNKEVSLNVTDCLVNTVPLLAFCKEDNPAIQITLTLKGGKSYSAILVSRGSDQKRNAYSMNLPVLFCKGKNKEIIAMNRILERFFEFQISKVKMSVKEALVIIMIQLKNGDFDNDSNVELIFKDLETKDITIQYSINVANMKDLWASACESEDVDSTTEVVNLFYNAMLEHFMALYGVDLTYFALQSIKIEGCVIHLKGMVKSNVPEAYDFLLKHLTQRINFEKRV